MTDTDLPQRPAGVARLLAALVVPGDRRGAVTALEAARVDVEPDPPVLPFLRPAAPAVL